MLDKIEKYKSRKNLIVNSINFYDFDPLMNPEKKNLEMREFNDTLNYCRHVATVIVIVII